MSQNNGTYRTPKVKIPAAPALATTATCPSCGGPVFARNKIAQREINRAAGRVVQMTPRALARFQSFPDWYALPESKTLACRGIGNAVPPLMYRRVLEALL